MSTNPYKVHNWISKEIIRKENLNNMEQGIFNNNKGVRELEDNVLNILQNFAPVEPGEKAILNHSVDDVLVFGSRLCKATTSISIGDDLQMGANLVPTTIVELLQ